MHQNELTGLILKAAYTVHTDLGPGLLESAYETCLCYELSQMGLDVNRQMPMPLVYKSVKMDAGYRIDLLVNQTIVVEVKAIECFNDVHLAQMLTYLKLSKCKIGLMINFNVTSLKQGIKRVIL